MISESADERPQAQSRSCLSALRIRLGSGLVANLAHPGGNITGFTNFEFSIGEKWLQMLKELSPDVSRALVIMIPDNSGNLGLFRTIKAACAGARCGCGRSTSQ